MSEDGKREGDRPAAGMAVNGVAYLAISVNDMLAKLAVGILPVSQTLAIRSAFALMFLLPYIWWVSRRSGAVFRTRRFGLHFARFVVMVVSIVTFFEAFKTLDLATVTAIMFVTPIFVALLAIVFLRERVSPVQWSAIVAGFVGTAIIVKPGPGNAGIGAVLCLVSAVTWAAAMIMLRRLAATEKPATVLALFNVMFLPLLSVVAAFNWVEPSTRALQMIAAMGFLNVFGQWLGTHAFRLAPAAVVAPLQYTQILWASLFTWAVWNETPGWNVFVGAVIVIGAGLVLMRVGGR